PRPRRGRLLLLPARPFLAPPARPPHGRTHLPRTRRGVARLDRRAALRRREHALLRLRRDLRLPHALGALPPSTPPRPQPPPAPRQRAGNLHDAPPRRLRPTRAHSPRPRRDRRP